MSDKYPYITSTKISRKDGRKDNAVKSVKMKIYTSYKNDNPHTITFRKSDGEISLARHSKDYGNNMLTSMEKVEDDSFTAKDLAWSRLEDLGLDDVEDWYNSMEDGSW